MAERKQVTIEGARLIFCNFEGKEGQYNRKGDRNFAVLLPPDLAAAMAADGWNIRLLKAREEGDEDQPYLPVAVNFDNRPPRIVMVTSRARTNLDVNSVETLDYANIEFADLIVNGSNWEVNGKSGVKAYLKTLFATISEDDLERKYAINEVE